MTSIVILERKKSYFKVACDDLEPVKPIYAATKFEVSDKKILKLELCTTIISN